MALKFSRDILISTDKKYFFLESPEKESDGYLVLNDLLYEHPSTKLHYNLGYDSDPRYFLLPATLLTFNTEMEN